MKVISIYELLGLIKQGKQPNKIIYCGNVYEWEEEWYLTKEKNYKICLGGKKEDINQLVNAFNENVEIIEEDKEIKEINFITEHDSFTTIDQYKLQDKINELIKAVNELKKGK